VEQRDAGEITSFVPQSVSVTNPAFDVTPADLVTAIITDAGVVVRPDREQLATLMT